MHRIKHIFITGEIQSGKSSLINRVLTRHPDWQVAGFKTVTAAPAVGGDERGVYLVLAGDPADPCNLDNLVGIRLGHGRRTAKPDVFDKVELSLLCGSPQADLILMDELGTMENEALLFQQRVMSILDGEKPVLGVLKKKDTVFLNAIRDREDVAVIEVSFQTFEDCLGAADALLSKVVCRSLDLMT